MTTHFTATHASARTLTAACDREAPATDAIFEHPVGGRPRPSTFLAGVLEGEGIGAEVTAAAGWRRFCPQLQTILLEGEKGDYVYDPARRSAYLACLADVIEQAENP